MPSERLSPDALLTQTNLTGAVTDIDEVLDKLIFRDTVPDVGVADITSRAPLIGVSWTEVEDTGTNNFDADTFGGGSGVCGPHASATSVRLIVKAAPAPAVADQAGTFVWFAASFAGGDQCPFGVLLRYADNSNYYGFIVYQAASGNSFACHIFKKVGGTVTPLANANVKLNTDDSSNFIRCEVVGTALKMYVDGAEVVSATDSSLSAAGNMCIAAGNMKTSTDDINTNQIFSNVSFYEITALDSNWLTATDPAAAVTCRASFPTPSQRPKQGANLQEFRIWTRRTAGGADFAWPTMSIDLYENNSLVANLKSAIGVNNRGGEIAQGLGVGILWDASLLSTANGSQVECRVVGTPQTPGIPTFVGKGTASNTTGTSLTPTYPANMKEGDTLILVIGSTAPTNANSITALASPWAQKHALEGSSLDGQLEIWWRNVPAGGLSGTLAITVTTPDTNAACFAQFYAWRGCHPSSPFEGGALQSGSGTTVTMPSVTTTDVNRKAVGFCFIGADTATASPTGESNGNWAEAAAEDRSTTGNDGTLVCMAADLASAVTLSGGTFTVTSGGWACRGFALIPAAPTVEIGGIEWNVGLIDVVNQVNSGALTFAGIFIKRIIQRKLLAALTPAGVFIKRIVQRNITAALTPAGTQAAFIIKRLSLAGALTFAGGISKIITRPLAGALSLAGALVREIIDDTVVITQPLAGALAMSGNLIKKIALELILSGALTFAGSVTLFIGKVLALAGALAPEGAIFKVISKNYSGALTFAGGLKKVVIEILAGAIEMPGVLKKVYNHSLFTASISSTGSMIPRSAVRKTLFGALTMSGNLLTTAKAVGVFIASTIIRRIKTTFIIDLDDEQ